MRYFILAFFGLIILGCSNEFDLVADYKETPVVYGLLNPADTAQYIRVERTFIDKNTSANILAQNPDSLYYDDITVKVVRLSNGVEYTLNRVDGNQEGYVRDEGAFAQAPNYLYKIMTEDITLVEEEEYELRIEGVLEDKAITATTDIVIKPFYSSPQNEALIAFERNKKTNYGWNPKGDETVYSVSFYFNITESKDGQTTPKQLEWKVVSNTEKTTIDVFGTEFYSFMVGQLEEDPSITRNFISAEFELTTGNNDVKDYLRVAQANLGITSSGEIPVFTNVNDGLGLFGSKVSERRTELRLRQMTMDSLVDGSITKNLNF